MDDIRSQYFNWLLSIVNLPNHYRVLEKLFNTEFVWYIPFDANRAEDGIYLRYRFGRACNSPDPVICSELDLGVPCSILEMMVALSFRMESEYMASEHANRVGHWFWNMVDSMGLIDCKDPKLFEKILCDFNSRNYFENGKGGLFYIPGAARDMRRVSIWDQMNAWIIWQSQIK